MGNPADLKKDPVADDLFALGALCVALFGLVLSGFKPHDRFTWVLEVAPVVIVAPLLVATRRSFPLTPLAMGLIAFHALVLELGGRYTYALVPLGEMAKEAFDLSRNHYDRFGHLMQGFIPAIAAREVLLRKSPLRPSKMLTFLVVCVCMAVSASYELIEWGAAVATGEAADSFLGTQGDPWDTQWDMGMATIGAIFSLFLLSRFHDAQLRARSILD